MVRPSGRSAGGPRIAADRRTCVGGDGAIGEAATRLNGYSIILAQDADEARALAKDHPFLAQGAAYSIEVYTMA